MDLLPSRNSGFNGYIRSLLFGVSGYLRVLFKEIIYYVGGVIELAGVCVVLIVVPIYVYLLNFIL